MRILLRIGRRRAAWEPTETDLQTLLDTEFKTRTGAVDLTPSVYEVENEQPVVVRTVAEHAANAHLDPPRGTINYDFSGTVSQPATTEARFAFIRGTHRELTFRSRAELRDFVWTLLQDANRQGYSADKASILGYVRTRLAENDDEWLSFCRESQKRSWGC